MQQGPSTKWWPLFIAAFIAAMIVFGLQHVGYFRSYNTQLQDRLLDTRPASEEIVIVAIDDASIQELGTWPWKRRTHANLVEQLREFGAEKIVYDVMFSEASDIIDDELLTQAIFDAKNVVLARERELQPTEMLAEHALGVGRANVRADADGIVRTVDLEGSLAAVALGLSDVRGTYRIPYVGRPYTFSYHSAQDVLSASIPREAIEGKIVLIGATAPTLQDLHFTPMSLGEPMPGVEIHANIIQSLQEGAGLRTLDSFALALFYLAIAMLITFILSQFRLRIGLPLIMLFALGYIVVALIAASSGWLLPVIYPLGLIGVLAVIDMTYRYILERGKKRWVQEAFGFYLSPKVVDRLVRGETPLAPGGVKEELTILFSDIRGFTTISEAMSAEDLVELLNEYLTEMTELVLETDGVLDKYIGDAVMAFWGAPLPQNDHAERAARTAIAMIRVLDRLRGQWKKDGRPEIAIGIGLNTAEVVVGNMGSSRRFDYTVIGDGVNLAARLESATKQYKVDILISQAVRDQLGEAFVVRELDRVAVKGKKKPVTIYELVGMRKDVTGEKQEVLEQFSEALQLYRGQKWDEAKQQFRVLADMRDGPSAVFAERCDEMKAQKPGSDWDGVYIATAK